MSLIKPYESAPRRFEPGLRRTREYDAALDASGLTGDPEGLASTLLALENKVPENQPID